MKRSFDAIVVGAGIAGLGTAIGLARAGRKVLAVRKKGIKGEASPAAAGILDPFLEVDPADPQLRLNLAAFRRYPSFLRLLVAQTGQKSGYARTGMLYLAKTPGEEKRLQERYRWQKRTGIPVVSRGRDWIKKKEPLVSNQVRSGLFYSTVGRVDPRIFLATLRRWAQRLGIEFLESAAAPILSVEGRRVVGICVGKKKIGSDVVVNAAGSWTGRDRRLGMKLPVVPARGQILVVKGKDLKISTIVHSLDGAYIVPWAAGTYLLGSTVEFVGFKASVTREGIRSIRKRTEALVPAIRRTSCIAQWAGLRPFCRDERPLIGPTKMRGLYVVTGFYRSGILLGCYVGDLLAKAIVSGRMPWALRPFSPRRYD